MGNPGVGLRKVHLKKVLQVIHMYMNLRTARVQEKQWDFPGGPVVKISLSTAGAVGSSLTGKLRSHILHGTKKKTRIQKQNCNKFNKDFKNGPHQKKGKVVIAGLNNVLKSVF